MPVDGPQYPINLSLRGRSVLVVGGGPVATSKVQGLLDGGADTIHVVAPDVTDELARLGAEDGSGVTVDLRPYRTPEAAAHRLVVTATSDPAVNRQVFLDADAAGVWANSADDPANCSFTLPSRHRQGPILITVATGGHSPALSKWLRAEFGRQVGPEYAELVQLLADEREEIRSRGGSTEGLNWSAALDGGLVDLVRRHQLTEARELLRSCLSSPSE